MSKKTGRKTELNSNLCPESLYFKIRDTDLETKTIDRVSSQKVAILI